MKHTIKIASNIGRGCEHCNDETTPTQGDDSDITPEINHYTQKHGYRVLHVGAETSHAPNGQLWHSTVAILGHDNPPPPKPPVKIVIGGNIGGLPEKPGK